MTVAELTKQLDTYPAAHQVKIFDDWGSSFVLRPISNIVDSTEFEPTEKGVVAICFDLEKESDVDKRASEEERDVLENGGVFGWGSRD